jgi:exosortase/archaeosortase family protein
MGKRRGFVRRHSKDEARTNAPAPPDAPAATAATAATVPAGGRKLGSAELRFLLTFAAIAGVLCLLYCSPYDNGGTIAGWFRGYLGGYARIVGGVLGLFDPAVSVSGQVIAGRFGFKIARDCDAMEANIIFVAGVMAFSASWRQRAIGLIAGLAAIGFLNVVRLCVMYFCGIRSVSMFEFVHEWSGPILVAATFTLFLVWATWAKPAPPAPAHASP